MNAAPRRLSRAEIALHVAALAGTFVALAAWTWGTWPDVVVDFGRELYVPWRLALGERLYTDLAYFNGPLSPHWNALAFRVFGVGLSTLVWTNLALFAATLALLHCVLRGISTPFAATCACVVVMCTCGFGQLVGIGNYNYVCPYSHEATHGVLLGLAGLACAQRWNSGQRVVWAALAGLCVGLAFLTKPEMFVAALFGAGTALWLNGNVTRAAGAFAGGVALAIALAWCALATASSSAVATSGVLGAWPALFASNVAELKFYRAGMGLDAPWTNTLKMLLWSAGVLGMFVPSLLAERFITRRIGVRLGAPIAFALTAVAVLAFYARIPWLQVPRAWPLLALATAVIALVVWKRTRAPRAAGTSAFALFALAMLFKMLLNARLMNYGFALAMPATALVTVALVEWIPSSLARLRIDAATMRAGALPLVIAFSAAHLEVTSRTIARKDVVVGSGADAFRADERGRFVDAMLRWLRESFPDRRPTLAVLPEGVTINYLARLANPTPYVNFMPPEFALFGEANIVAAFDAHPPDVVLLVHKSTAEYGLPFFGRDYAQEFWRWLSEHYRPATDRAGKALLLGDPPLQPGSRFGMAVLVRR